ncbi:MAG: NAD(+)/NADH kinase [Planctomyces sp.]|nr:NAD(+)/NADH kinase [Planctomyces sp.]
MRVCVIANSNAGRGRVRRWMRSLESAAAPDVNWRRTAGPRHATQLTRDAIAEGCDVIAAAGGDGTIHEVVQALMQVPDPPVLAVLPGGSANDFVHSVQRQFGWRSLRDGTSDAVDVGEVRTADGGVRWFINSLGFSLSAAVGRESARLAGWPGWVRYGLATWRALRTTSVVELAMAADAAPSDVRGTLLLALLLGRREGGFTMAPDASLNDGWFDVVHAGPLSRLRAVSMLPRLLVSGPPRHDPAIQLSRCRRLRVTSAEVIPLHADGELLTTSPQSPLNADITLLPARLRVKACRLSAEAWPLR